MGLSLVSASRWPRRGSGIRGSRRWPGSRPCCGSDKLSRSAAALQQALEVEPAFAPALIELSRVALAQRFNASLSQALGGTASRSGLAGAAEPEVLLARGRIERLVGSPDSALAAFRALRGGRR